MGDSDRMVRADTALAAVLALVFVTALGVAVHVEGPLGDGFLPGFVILLGGPAWLALWALLLRRAQAPAWWASPVVCALPACLVVVHLDTERPTRASWPPSRCS